MTMFRAEPRRPAHFSPDAVELLRSLLLCQIAYHADQVAECRATVDELTGQTDSDRLLERALADAPATHFAAIVQEARGALGRLEDGTYGTCESCGAPIPYARLEAIPHARRCVSCPDAPTGLLG